MFLHLLWSKAFACKASRFWAQARKWKNKNTENVFCLLGNRTAILRVYCIFNVFCCSFFCQNEFLLLLPTVDIKNGCSWIRPRKAAEYKFRIIPVCSGNDEIEFDISKSTSPCSERGFHETWSCLNLRGRLNQNQIFPKGLFFLLFWEATGSRGLFPFPRIRKV